jgi:uncharacterized protein (TIRG00374 family)
MTEPFRPLHRLRALLRRPSAHLAVSLLVAALFLVWAFRGTDLAQIVSALESANYWWLLLSFGSQIVSHLVRAWRWGFLLAPMKEGIGLRNLFSGVMIGYFVNNLLPRAGELARPYAIGKLERISGSAALGTVVVERVMDTMTFLFLVFAAPLVYSGPLLESFPWLRSGSIVLLLVMLPLFLLLVVLMMRRDWADRVLAVLTRFFPEKAGARLRQLVHAFLDGFQFVRRPWMAIRILLLTGVIWGLYMTSLRIAFVAFGSDMELGWGAAWVLLAISSVGIAIPTPGGTGTYHAFAARTLTLLFQIEGAVALSFATATHAVNFIGVTVVGLVYFLRDHMTFAETVKPGVMEEA